MEKNIHHSETQIAKLRNLLSPIKSITSMLSMLEHNGISEEEKQDLLNVGIPDALKVCDENKSEIFKLAKNIDIELIKFIEQGYELNEVLLESSDDTYIYEVNQYNEEVLNPIMRIINGAEKREQERKMFSLLLEYFFVKNGKYQDTEKEEVLKKQIEKSLPQLESLLGIMVHN